MLTYSSTSELFKEFRDHKKKFRKVMIYIVYYHKSDDFDYEKFQQFISNNNVEN